ncbi:DUF397 domain-containing protein [Streptomyces lacrimifluminis]|uniref:DUF397 domain-containing protein n=1 Tax=Streptomyces lacrimifluminis TaxID=1500077 RepID=UPI00166E9D9A|nr:DUF397 domain-containing protein [Streptomyces lacrimifluminis]
MCGHDRAVTTGHLATTESPRWFTSSYSDNGGACRAVAANLVASRGLVPVRDSKNPSGPVLGFPVDAFSSFVDGVNGVNGVNGREFGAV